MPEGKVIPFNEASLEIIERRAQTEGSVVVQEATRLEIEDSRSYVSAGEFRKEINRRDAALEAEFKPIKQSLDAAKRKVLDFEKKARGPLAEARGIVDSKILAYEEAAERERQAEEAKLREAARKADEERRIREAEEMVKEGVSQEDALAALDATPPPPAPSLGPAVPKVMGMSFREVWSAEVLDLHSLICHVAMHPELVNLLTPSESGLNAMARAQKGAFNLPGVRALCERKVAGSRT